MSRKSGYYVCRNCEILSVAYWDGSRERWYITGSEYSYKDSDFTEVGNSPLDLSQIVRGEEPIKKPIVGIIVEWRWNELHPLPTLDDYFDRVKEIGSYLNRCVDASEPPADYVIEEFKSKFDKIVELYKVVKNI